MSKKNSTGEASRQWSVSSGSYRAMGSSQPTLPPGAYSIQTSVMGPYLEKHPVVADTIMVLPDAQNGLIMESMARFWDREKVYNTHGLVHKRGILLHGPPGTGKTSIINMLADKLAEAYNGVTLFARSCELLKAALKQLRDIEPTRKIMVVFEDLDNIIDYDDETELLSILDGENQVGGIVYLATTNNIGKLSARVVNRPSRFDEIIRVGYPTYDARRSYMERLVDGCKEIDIEMWARDTDGFSMAHLKELVVSVAFLELDYAKSLNRLKTMAETRDSESGFYVGDGTAPDEQKAVATAKA